MARQYRKYTDQDIIDAVKDVKSIAQLLKKLGLKPVGGNYINIKSILKKLNIDCSHFTGSGWSKGKRLLDWDQYTKVKYFKDHLIKEKGKECEKCHLTKWDNQDIPLEVHHIDGDRTNNSFDNLRLYCCNCHALTDNWRGRKIISTDEKQ